MWTQLFQEYWLPFLLVATGVGTLAGGLYLRFRTAASRNWPSVRGTVVVNRVRAEVHPREQGGPPLTRYYPEVEYEYTVAGRSYRSKRIRFGGLPFVYSTDRAEIEAWFTAHYPEGSEVEVYYNPLRPEEAVLEPGSSPAATLLLVVGTIMLLGGILLALRR